MIETQKKRDVSNGTVMLMLVFLVVVTASSFVVYFNALDKAAPVVVSEQGPAKISLNVKDRVEPVNSNPVFTGANLGLTVVNPPPKGGMN